MTGRAYLDHASSTPLRPAALEAMLPILADHHADPGRVHAEGRVTRIALEEAREQVAALLGARPREVVFTSSGTEAANAAVWGAVERARAAGADGAVHVVATAVEHSAVLDACRRAATTVGAEVTVVGVDGSGRVDPAAVVAALRPSTALVNVQLANHEVGTIQPVAPIVDAAHERGIAVHVDACASSGHLPLSFAELGADLCSVTGHKLGGPKGAAALLIRRGLRIPPLVVGGAQERARRGGIEDVAAAVGFGAAAAELGAGDRLEAEARAAAELVARAEGAARAVDGIDVYGDPDPVGRLPHLLCLGVAGVEAEPVLLGLDQRGVAVHSGSSCSSEALEPSPVLAAMGVDADHSLRLSVGWDSTPADVERFAAALPEVVADLRSLRA
ncbi:MAG: cysteine desulfurase [Acidimicrobiia bacterium]|nr:cysteine desulfurase [Acidimicrobiia bacterium]